MLNEFIAIFKRCIKVEAIKKEYRELAMRYHPDLGGSKEAMQQLNAAYHRALKLLDGDKTYQDGKEFVYKYDEKIEQELADKINEILALRLPEIEVHLIGVWIWITGNTRAVKEQLKQLACNYHAKRQCWYWRKDSKRSWSRSPNSLDQLAERYGVKSFKSTARDAIG